MITTYRNWIIYNCFENNTQLLKAESSNKLCVLVRDVRPEDSEKTLNFQCRLNEIKENIDLIENEKANAMRTSMERFLAHSKTPKLN